MTTRLPEHSTPRPMLWATTQCGIVTLRFTSPHLRAHGKQVSDICWLLTTGISGSELMIADDLHIASRPHHEAAQ